MARRFRCLTASCRRSIFTERFGDDVLATRPLGASFIHPTLLTAAERLQYEGYLRREEVNAAILARAEGGADDQKDCAGDESKSRARLKNPARPAFGYYPHTGEFTGPASSVARRAMGYRQSQWR